MRLITTPDLTQFPETHYVFIEKIGPFQETAMAAWQQFHQNVASISANHQMLGAFAQYKVEPQMIYRAGAAIDRKPDSLPEGFKYEHFKGGVYQRATLMGGYENLPEACGVVFAQVEREKFQMRDDWFLENYINNPNDRKAEELVSEILLPAQTEIKPFRISREFKASHDLMWKLWTEKEYLEKWSGPKGTKLKQSTFDLKAGATNHYCMVTPDGNEMWGKQIFREVMKPDRYIYISSFSDNKGNVTRHPMSNTWPLEMLTTVTFSPSGDKTRVTVEWSPLNANETEIKTFNDAHEGMKMGWTGSLDTLEEVLKTL